MDENNYLGVALYRIKLNGSLVGKWTVSTNGAPPEGPLGTEIAIPKKRRKRCIRGDYDVTITLPNKDEPIFKGVLNIKKLQKNSYQMTWTPTEIGTTSYTGYAVKRRRNLAANYWNIVS